MSARSPVTRTTPRDAGLAQRAHHPGRVGPDRVLQQEGASGLAVDGGEDRQRAVQVSPPAHLAHPPGRLAADDPRGLAEPDPVSADGPLQAVAVHLPDVGRHLQRKPATGGGGDDGARQHMRRYLVQ